MTDTGVNLLPPCARLMPVRCEWARVKGKRVRGKGKERWGAAVDRCAPPFVFYLYPLPFFLFPFLLVRAARGVVADLRGEVADAVLVEEVAQGADGELEEFGGARLVAAGAAQGFEQVSLL
ncbi:MAG: hypothetical protein QOE47_2740 [Pyrinomonadaceae bacterium]|nr:hypothetical protein [Pyrinomonadaceae bacterium]